MRAHTHLGPCLVHRGLRTMALRTHPSSSHTILVRQHSNWSISQRSLCLACLLQVLFVVDCLASM